MKRWTRTPHGGFQLPPLRNIIKFITGNEYPNSSTRGYQVKAFRWTNDDRSTSTHPQRRTPCAMKHQDRFSRYTYFHLRGISSGDIGYIPYLICRNRECI